MLQKVLTTRKQNKIPETTNQIRGRTKSLRKELEILKKRFKKANPDEKLNLGMN